MEGGVDGGIVGVVVGVPRMTEGKASRRSMLLLDEWEMVMVDEWVNSARWLNISLKLIWIFGLKVILKNNVLVVDFCRLLVGTVIVLGGGLYKTA